MQSGSYVVHLVGCDNPDPFKHFGMRADAVAYGQSRVQSGEAEQAIIYAVADTSDARTAITAFRTGRATYVQSCSRHASEAEIEAANERAWEAARTGGPQAVLRFLGLVKGPPDPHKIRRRKL
jgi:hypothetical protein